MTTRCTQPTATATPFIAEKLSRGFARITGTPPDFTGANLRAPSGETRGEGAAGRKASGMLMVDGVLYLWARNAANSQLAWSHDHGATWTWADWRFTASFGCPIFLNFGKNYAGARDEFVYVYSPDSNSAYETADRLVLAHVPKTHLRERAAYRFFAGLDASGQPRWTRETRERGAVFTHRGHCYRLGITYNAALRRYLLAQPLANAASRDGAGKLDVRLRRRPRHLRRARIVGAVDDRFLHRAMGRWAGRHRELSDEVDGRGWQDLAPGLFRR